MRERKEEEERGIPKNPKDKKMTEKENNREIM